MASKSTVAKRIKRVRHALDMLEAGLNGNPQTLGVADGKSVQTILLAVGFELLTRNQITKRGYRLKRGQEGKPLMYRYYQAPISNYGNLYDLHSQCVKVEE